MRTLFSFVAAQRCSSVCTHVYDHGRAEDILVGVAMLMSMAGVRAVVPGLWGAAGRGGRTWRTCWGSETCGTPPSLLLTPRAWCHQGVPCMRHLTSPHSTTCVKINRADKKIDRNKTIKIQLVQWDGVFGPLEVKTNNQTWGSNNPGGGAQLRISKIRVVNLEEKNL